MDKHAYITVLSNDKYFPGIKGLYFSWKRTNPRYPLYIMIGRSVSENVRMVLSSMANLIDIESIDVGNIIERSNQESFNTRWNFTFDKLLVFEQTQFDKVVFLDADMMILQNLDDLFDKPHMSAVCAGASYPGNESWKDLNSGIMVIEPKKGLANELVKMVPKVLARRKSFGDQDLLQEYYSGWKDDLSLNLGEKYNIFSDYLDYYVGKLGYHFSKDINDEKSIAVIHFAGERKPWSERKPTCRSLLEQAYYIFCVGIGKYSLKRYKILYYRDSMC